MDSRVVIVCALEIERRALAKALRGRASVRRLGPGPGAMRSLLPPLIDESPGALVLAGVAGGLRPTQICPPITRVIDRDGNAWTPSLSSPTEEPAATVIGVDQAVCHPQEKAELAASADAELVDCESHVFAEIASAAGVAWTVVRGVSDGPDSTLPIEATGWVDDKGKTKPARVAIDLVRRPRLIRRIASLAARTNLAMDAAAARVRAIVEEQG